MNADASQFDPATFLDAATTEALVRRPPIPAGSELLGEVGEPKARSWQSNKPDAKVKSGMAIDLPVTFDLTQKPDVQAAVGADRVVITAGIMLDLNDGGQIDWSPGKNNTLRRWREALNMNTAGQTFSIRAMQGRTIKAKIKHRIHEGEAYDEIDTVARAS